MVCIRLPEELHRRLSEEATNDQPLLQIRVRSTLFSGRTASSRRFRARKAGICGWSTPASDAAKVVLLGEVLKLRWRGPTPPLRVTWAERGFEHQRAPSPLCVTAPVRRWALLPTRRPVQALPHLQRGLALEEPAQACSARIIAARPRVRCVSARSPAITLCRNHVPRPRP